MSIQFSSSTLQFNATQNELQYIVKCIPASESIKITVEGTFEIALGNTTTPNFGKELILLPDTTTTPHRIERIILVKKLNPVGKGSLIHTISSKNEKYLIGLEATTDNKTANKTPQVAANPTIIAAKTEPISPKKETPKIPHFTFSKTDISFGKLAPGIAKSQSFSIVSQHISKYTLEVALPFKLSLDNKTFVNTLTIEPNPTHEAKQIYVQMQSLTEGKHKQSVYIRAQNVPARQIILTGNCTIRKPFQFPKTQYLSYFLLGGFALWGLYALVGRGAPNLNEPNVKNSKILPQPTVNPMTVSLDDPTCKPSLYQKLKEKTTVVRYGCVSKDCDTAFIREILTYSSGSKAFHFVNLHTNPSNETCGQWVEQAFKENKVDIMFSDQNCNLNSIDQSHSICNSTDASQKCTFLIPCGNGDGLLKVINKEIRRRKSKMNILND